MIKTVTKAVEEDLPEMTVNLNDVRFIDFLPTCPQCKKIGNVLISNVTKAIYECTACKLRFHIAKKEGLSFWKRG